MANDTPFYRAVAEELRSGKIDDGLWLKALVESQGDEKMAKIQYTKLRVTELQAQARKQARGQETAEAEAEHRREEVDRTGNMVMHIIIAVIIIYVFFVTFFTFNV